MPRTARAVRPGGVYHVLNRGNGRADLFHKPADFDAFLRVLAEALARSPVDLFAWCLMTNHWHLVLRPRPVAGRDGIGNVAHDATGDTATPDHNGADRCIDSETNDCDTGNALRLMGWVGVTHVRRHHEHYHTRGGGHLYQGRFKSFPVQDDPHFLTVCRYVESNPLRAGIVRRAEDWPFRASAGRRV